MFYVQGVGHAVIVVLKMLFNCNWTMRDFCSPILTKNYVLIVRNVKTYVQSYIRNMRIVVWMNVTLFGHRMIYA